MDPFSTALAFGAPVIGMIKGVFDAQSAQEKLMKTQLAQERMIAGRDRLNQVRQLRTATAAVQQQGANTGVAGSSAIAGGVATAYGQAGQNIQYINNQEMYGQKQTQERQSYNNAMGLQELSKDVFSIASSAASGGF